jgi:tungstate transport system substrate-binding protein
MMRLAFNSILALLMSLVLCSCDQKPNKQILRIAVTTSTRDSGLLKTILPDFEKQKNVEVQVIAVGTGKALKLAEMGEVDAVLVHARKSEDAFMKAGNGSRRIDVMVNYFLLVGPANDPAKVSNLTVKNALAKIKNSGQKFISRADNSGTHKKELSLWGGQPPTWKDYIKSGQGMGATLIMADQLNAYTLTDIGTFLKMSAKTDLRQISRKEPPLLNPYGAMVVNPKKHKTVKAQLANQFLDFLIAKETQKKIASYRINNQTLFHPVHIDPKDN